MEFRVVGDVSNATFRVPTVRSGEPQNIVDHARRLISKMRGRQDGPETAVLPDDLLLLAELSAVENGLVARLREERTLASRLLIPVVLPVTLATAASVVVLVSQHVLTPMLAVAITPVLVAAVALALGTKRRGSSLEMADLASAIAANRVALELILGRQPKKA